MIHLPRVTLLAADTAYHGATIASLRKSMAQCSFGRVVFLTNIEFNLEGIDVIQIKPLKSKDDYSYFMLKEAWKYVQTDFALVTQHDSWVLNGNQFDERLYQTDYAGGLWLENDGLANGNGGFSWRSKRLMEAVAKDEMVRTTAPEDVMLCRVYRRYLEDKYGFVWATDEICEQFSFELRSPTAPTFGFHAYFHKPYQKTVLIRRWGAFGDVVAIQPVLRYFHDKGYRTVLDTHPKIFNMFLQHEFKVHHPDEIDQRHLKNAEVYNCDMSYENDPQRLHLQVYYEYCGVKKEDMVITNPKLSLAFNPKDTHNKLFKKYAVIHYDKRPQGGRNIHGVNWDVLCAWLKGKGYEVIQIGMGERQIISDAVQMNTPTELMMMWVIGGADLFIGGDSGPANVAVAMGTPAVIFFGNVDPKYIYPDLSKITVIQKENACDTPKCWHRTVGCEGMKCIVDESRPPCIEFDTEDVLQAINKTINATK